MKLPILLGLQLYEKKPDPSPMLSIVLGLGAVILVGIGVYFAVKRTLKTRSSNDDIWETATAALGVVRSNDWSAGVKSMTGLIDGRDVVFSSMLVTQSDSVSSRLYRYNLCRLSFTNSLGSAFGVIPKTAVLWQNIGGNMQTIHAAFNKEFKISAENKVFLTELLVTPLDEGDGLTFAAELADRSEQKHQWIHFTESMLEFGYRYKDNYKLIANDDLESQLRQHFSEAVEFAARIERRAERLRDARSSMPLEKNL